MASRKFRKIAIGGLALGGSAVLGSWALSENQKVGNVSAVDHFKARPTKQLPTRNEQLKALQENEFDVLVIGGGATGVGCALDSVTRGLKTALVELDDFSSGTSSRSTKLIHGGVRYLQKAIFNFDKDQYHMVQEALHERGNLLDIAPHLSYPLPIMLPVYKWWQIPYYWAGIKAYDFVAGRKNLKSSYYLSKEKALELFPMLRKDKLCGAIVYYDGQHNDARMNIAIALTAARLGGVVANHVRVIKLNKSEDNEGKLKICGARVRDEITGKEWDVKSKCVINATGPFTDSIRQMDDNQVNKICAPSAGVHIVLPGYYSPESMGLLDPATSDGRVIFFLPWQGLTIAGTTDSPCEVTLNPSPTEADIQFILKEVRNYLNPDIEVRRGDVLSAWSGIRPLVSDPNKPDTQSLARNHIVHVSDSGLVTIAGGKWTTYRSMAVDTLDAAVKSCDLPAVRESATDGLPLEGAHGWSPTMFIRLVQDFGLECEVAQHLASTYGDRAFSVAKLASLTGKRWPIVGRRLHEEFPYIDAEVRYAIREYACTAVDVIARRLRLAFLNVQATEEALPAIINIMAEELKWSESEKKNQLAAAMEFLKTEMGQNVNRQSRDKMPINLSREEVAGYIKRFQALDKERKGYVSINDIRRGLKTEETFSLFSQVDEDELHFALSQTDVRVNGQTEMHEFIQRQGEEISGAQLHEILRELDTNSNGLVELDEYLQLMAAIKAGRVSNSRFARMAEMNEEQLHEEGKRNTVAVERSGGGV